MSHILYLDQNAWVALARGAWDKGDYPREHETLIAIFDAVNAHGLVVPLSFTNLYETTKINDPLRRVTMAGVQATLSGGRVFRARRRILRDTLTAYLASHFSLPHPAPTEHWFISNLWFEAVADYSFGAFDSVLSQRVVDAVLKNPGEQLFSYLVFDDEAVRREAVRRYTASSLDLLARIEGRRRIAAAETLALRKRAYGAQLVLDELEFVLATGRGLGLEWRSVGDIGSSLLRKLIVDIPMLYVEKELAVRIEDRNSVISENDLRDMSAFITTLPFADIIVAEKHFVNLSRQARLGERYETKLLTSIFDLPSGLL
jgi:hypothetical protein